MDPDIIKERGGKGKMAQDEDMFDETFQYESQVAINSWKISFIYIIYILDDARSQ